jgi:xylulokinase
MTVVPYGGNSLRWFKEVIRPESSFEQLNSDASEVQIGSEGLLFVPISSSKSGKGSFQNIDGIHTIKHFTRAVFEGVAFVNWIHFNLFQQAGLQVEKLIMIGGGAKSSLWPHIVADVCNVVVELPQRQEAACAGAAVLAASGCKFLSSIEEGSRCFKGRSSIVAPSGKNVELYKERFKTFLDFLHRV